MPRQYRLLLLLIVLSYCNSTLVAFSLGVTSKHQPKNENVEERTELLVFGLGSVGSEVSKLARPYFSSVIGTVRPESTSPDSFLGLKKKGIERVPLEEINEFHINNATHILLAMPPIDSVWQSVFQHFFIENKSHTTDKRWLGMISTTGVYGNHNGAWVTEESSLFCKHESSAFAYKEWEERFQQKAELSTCRVCVFRCAGIYDSSKSALHTVWKNMATTPPPSLPLSSTTTSNRNETMTNRIHVSDIASAVLTSMDIADTNEKQQLRQRNFRVFNLADDCPAKRSQVLNYANHLLSLVNSTNISNNEALSLSDTATRKTTRQRRREADRKLIDNDRMKQELLSKLQYPTYKEGLEAICKDPDTPWNNQK
jgi:hypothetical protein